MYFYYLKQIVACHNGKKKVDNRGVVSEIKPVAHASYNEVHSCYQQGNRLYKDSLGNIYLMAQVDGDEQVPMGVWRVFDPSRVAQALGVSPENVKVIKKDYHPRTTPLYPYGDRRRFWKEYTYTVEAFFPPESFILKNKEFLEWQTEFCPDKFDHLVVKNKGCVKTYNVRGDAIALISTSAISVSSEAYTSDGKRIPKYA